MSLWGIGQSVVIYLAGLNDISSDYYEAAEIDGAGWFSKVKSVTLPLLTPVIFYNLVMGVINAFQQFTLPYTLTNGQGTPADSMKFYVMYLYDNGFKFFKMGYASAMAWILFIIVMVLTAVIFGSSKKMGSLSRRVGDGYDSQNCTQRKNESVHTSFCLLQLHSFWPRLSGWYPLH